MGLLGWLCRLIGGFMEFYIFCNFRYGAEGFICGLFIRTVSCREKLKVWLHVVGLKQSVVVMIDDML